MVFIRAIIISLLLTATALAESASDYLHRSAQKYIFGDEDGAQSEIDAGLQKYPDDVGLHQLAGLLHKKKPPPPQQQPKQSPQHKGQNGQDQEQQQQQQQQQQPTARGQQANNSSSLNKDRTRTIRSSKVVQAARIRTSRTKKTRIRTGKALLRVPIRVQVPVQVPAPAQVQVQVQPRTDRNRRNPATALRLRHRLPVAQPRATRTKTAKEANRLPLRLPGDSGQK